jgi:dihydroorotate dehydrogenase (fumarate)
MADLATTYLGLRLPTPLVVGSSPLTNRLENLQQAEDAGAGAVVLRSLFEEQIERETAELEELAERAGVTAEAASFFPPPAIGPRAYLQHLAKAKKAVKIPVIASLNCAVPGSWSAYAKQLEEAGADALEVNLYLVAADPSLDAAALEARYGEIVTSIRETVRIPLALKLSPYFTSFAHAARRFDELGANGLVLFNRFLQPDIDEERLDLVNVMPPPNPTEMRLSLRWVALLHGKVRCDLAASGGILDARSVVRQLLAGATVVQLTSALVQHGIPYLGTVRRGLEDWMTGREYGQLADFRGLLSGTGSREPWAYERAQYVSLILSQVD